jgi:hypothetical protein
MKMLNHPLLNENKMYNYIDQLIINKKFEEAIPFIEEVWKKQAQAEEKIVADLYRRLDAWLSQMLL